MVKLSFDIESIFHHNPSEIARYQGLDCLEYIIERLGDHKRLATFYCTSSFVEANPKALQLILSSGNHSIGSHSANHKNLDELSNSDLHYEISHSKKVLEDLTGRPINSFRAPCFRIPRNNAMFWDMLAAEGYLEDSSIVVPSNHKAPKHKFITIDPVVAVRFLGITLMPGGRYSRFVPPNILRSIAGSSGSAYFHLHDFDTNISCGRQKRFANDYISRLTALNARSCFESILSLA